MPLKFASEPPNGTALVSASLRQLAARRRPGAQPAALRGVNISALKLQPPHTIYDLRADEVAQGHGLATARATALRYLVANHKAVAAAELYTDASGEARLVANMNYGPFVEATARAFDYLTTLPQVASGTYEARLLRFSAIYLMAVWLKSEGNEPDIIYPLAPAPPGLVAEKIYGVSDFLQVILPIARKRATNTRPPAVP